MPEEVEVSNGDAPLSGSESSDEEIIETGTSPVKLGYRTFPEGKAAAEYFRNLLASAALNTFLPEYEHLLLLDLIKKGHKKAAEKISTGVKGFQVRTWKQGEEQAGTSRAFFIIRKDGSMEDFSYLKSLDGIFPGTGILSSRIQAGRKGPGRGGRGGKKFGGRGRGAGRGRN